MISSTGLAINMKMAETAAMRVAGELKRYISTQNEAYLNDAKYDAKMAWRYAHLAFNEIEYPSFIACTSGGYSLKG